jgi:hypothetical protein
MSDVTKGGRYRDYPVRMNDGIEVDERHNSGRERFPVVGYVSNSRLFDDDASDPSANLLTTETEDILAACV